MAFALDLHREPPPNSAMSAEGEDRRRLFWTCYLMDRFAAAGSQRPSLIPDECIVLRLPSWQPHLGAPLVEGDFFFPGSAQVQHMADRSPFSHGGMAMLIGIAKMLGTTNRYLAAGGARGDVHVPWHSLSRLSLVRQELKAWAAETHDTFSVPPEFLFGRPDTALLVLAPARLPRRALPAVPGLSPLGSCRVAASDGPVPGSGIDAAPPPYRVAARSDEAVLCARQRRGTTARRRPRRPPWTGPAFAAFSASAAGSVHVHGAHYRRRAGPPRLDSVVSTSSSLSAASLADDSDGGGERGAATAFFAGSADALARELLFLAELRFAWAGAQHQWEVLQAVCTLHAQLVESGSQDSRVVSAMPPPTAAALPGADFWERYAGCAEQLDGAFLPCGGGQSLARGNAGLEDQR